MGFKVLGFRVWGLWFEASGFECSGFRFWVLFWRLGFRVEILGLESFVFGFSMSNASPTSFPRLAH